MNDRPVIDVSREYKLYLKGTEVHLSWFELHKLNKLISSILEEDSLSRKFKATKEGDEIWTTSIAGSSANRSISGSSTN